MKSIHKAPLPLLTLLMLNLPVFSQNWNLVKRSDGIEVYTKEVSTSNFNAFKAEMTVKASIEDLEYILKNLDRYKQIFPDTKELTIIKRIGENKHIQYSHTKAPWPVSDRDGIFEMTFKEDTSTGGFSSIARALPDYLPEKKGVVRIRTSKSSWDAIPKENGLIHIIYQVEAEPGGNIPDWLANSAASELPFNTFTNLKEVLSK